MCCPGRCRGCLSLMIRPLGQAVWLICPDLCPTGELFEAVANAWERYHRVRGMPWGWAGREPLLK